MGPPEVTPPLGVQGGVGLGLRPGLSPGEQSGMAPTQGPLALDPSHLRALLFLLEEIYVRPDKSFFRVPNGILSGP